MEFSRDLIVSTKKLKPRLSSLLQQHPAIRFREENFIRINPIVDPAGLSDLDMTAPLVFTSGNAQRIASSYYPVIRNFHGIVYTLDGPSADEAYRNMPHAQIRTAGKNGMELANVIIEEQAAGAITFFCGNKRHDGLPDMLREKKFQVREILVYEIGFAPHQLHEPPVAALFFSPSAVESYLMANQLGKETACIAIGSTTADLLRRQQYGLRILTATSPSQDAVVDTLLEYLNTIQR